MGFLSRVGCYTAAGSRSSVAAGMPVLRPRGKETAGPGDQRGAVRVSLMVGVGVMVPVGMGVSVAVLDGRFSVAV